MTITTWPQLNGDYSVFIKPCPSHSGHNILVITSTHNIVAWWWPSQVTTLWWPLNYDFDTVMIKQWPSLKNTTGMTITHMSSLCVHHTLAITHWSLHTHHDGGSITSLSSHSNNHRVKVTRWSWQVAITQWQLYSDHHTVAITVINHKNHLSHNGHYTVDIPQLSSHINHYTVTTTLWPFHSVLHTIVIN